MKKIYTIPLARKVFRLFIVTLLASLCTQVFANQDELEQLIHDANSKINIGVKVQNLTNGEVIFAKNANRTYIPASNQKVVTAVAALLYLGSEYRFQTKLLVSEHSIDNGQLNGDLYFKFSGDPDLRIRDIDELVVSLTNHSINRINGNIYIDDSSYGGQDLGPGWMWDDTGYCFSSPIGANILNQNCVALTIKPSATVGQPIQVQFSDANQYINIINEAVTKPKNTKGCYTLLKAGPKNSYTLSGCLRANIKKHTLTAALTDSDLFINEVIKGLFKKHSIAVMGKYKQKRAKGDLTELEVHQSRPLREHVAMMLKESDNLVSDTVFKKIGLHYFRSQGTWKTGSKAIRKILETWLKDYDGVIADGSGLSRYNLVSPDEMVVLLSNVYKNERVANEFIAALPVSGVNGTLKDRMVDQNAKGKVKAKTGTMANVTALSGYIYTLQNNVLAFSILINGIPGSTKEYQDLEDRFCQFLVTHY